MAAPIVIPRYSGPSYGASMRTIILCLLIFAVACDNTLPKDPGHGLATVDTGTTGAGDEDADADADDPVEDDDDGDGYNSDVDCDDSDANVNPGATEDCATAADDNCSGDTNEPDALGCSDFYIDGDGDGFGGTESQCYCEPTETYALLSFEDCDDTNGSVNPGAIEVCATPADDDCSGETNDQDAIGCIDFFIDEDGDGFGGAESQCHCEPTDTHHTPAFDDCDDDDSNVSPMADEVCDGIDNDCDFNIDDEDSSLTGALSTFYIDSDADGLGSTTATFEGCTAPAGYLTTMDDCDDGDSTTGAATDWYTDGDGDGYGGEYEITLCMGYAGLTELDGDCDDDDPTFGPDEVDYCGDGIDHDCSGEPDDWGPECIDLEPQDVLSMVSCSGSETGTAFTVEGDHIKARYGSHGMWWDSDAAEGLQIQPSGTTGFKDVTYPGARMDYLIVDMGSSSSSIGRFTHGSSDPMPSDYSVICAESIRVGDVMGATHTYRYSWGSWVTLSMTVRKTELWNEAGETMLVHFAIQPGLFTGPLTPRIQRLTDFDIDGDSDDEFDSVFDQTGSTGFVSSSGAISDITVGMGDCSSAGNIGSYDGWHSAEVPTEDLCNPRDWTDDVMTIYDLTSTSASALEPASHGYVLTIGASASDAETLWNDNAADYCGDLWEPSSSASFPGGMCNGTIISVPDDLAEL